MAVKGKGKQVATDNPGASGSSGKRRKGSSDAGPSSSSAKRRRSGVLQFVDDAAGVDDDYEDEEEEGESEEDFDDGIFTAERVDNVSHKRTERSHPLPFLVKEEELSGDELEEFVRNRYSSGVKYAADRNFHQEDDDDAFPTDCALKEPTIWRVKCMVGRERQMVFCFMQKFVDLQKIGTKVPVITAFALDHMRGFFFVEAEKACDVTEACKGFCSVYASRITSVPAAELTSLLSSRTKPFEIARGTWVRMKNGNYKGDLAQVVSADDGRKRVMIKLIPRVDLHAISRKFGGAISLKEAGVPAPRLISSQELEFFRPHIEMKRDRQTGEVFEVLDGLMFKDGFLYKRVALSSLIYWGIQPTETELLKFSSSPSNKSSTDDLDWVSSIYGSKKRNLPENRDMRASSKAKSCKASNLKASTSTEIFDDNEEFNLHDLVLFGRKDFGVVIAVEKDGFKILKGGPEGSAVTVRKQEIKKSCVDKMFTAIDHQKKIISINDTVRVLEGPSQGKEGVVKHLYLGILFIYNESESENFGFFCAQCGSCENIKKRKETENSTAGNLEDNPVPMFSQPSYEQNEQRSTERPYRSTREQLFSIGQMLRIRKGPLKGYLCRVVRIFRNDVTVKLDSLLKIVTVQAEFLSATSNRGNMTFGASTGNLGSQGTSLFGSEADKTSWDNGLPSFGSDAWQPFSSSTFPVQNTDGESEVDPWGKKTVSSTEDDSDPWSKKTLPSADGNSDTWGQKMGSSADDGSDPWGSKTTSSAVEVWNSTQKESSTDDAWGEQAGVGGSDAAGSSWGRTTANKEGEKSNNWGDACRVEEDMETGGNTDPWGSKVKVADAEENDNWAKASMPSDNKAQNDNQGWQPLGKSNEGQGKDKASKDADNSGSWDTVVTGRGSGDGVWGKSKDNNGDGAVGWNEAKSSYKNTSAGGWDIAADNWNKSSAVAQGQEEAWGKGNASKSVEINNSSDWGKPKSFGGDGSSGLKGEETRDDQNSSWSRPGNFEGGHGFGRGRGRGRGRESGDFDGRNDQGSWKSSWGGDNAGRPPWRSNNQVDNEAGDSDGYRGRGRGRGQYGGRGRDNGWRNGDRSNSGFGRESDCGDEPEWGNRGSRSFCENQSSTWNSSAENKPSVGEHNDPWASKVTSTEGKEQQNDPWGSKTVSTACAEDNGGSWNSKAKDSSSNDGGDERQNDPWANNIGSNKGKEQETDPWASKVHSATGADDNNDSWNTKAKDTRLDSGDKWGSAAPVSSGAEDKADAWASKGSNDNSKKSDGWGAGSFGASWDKPSFSLGDQEPAWGKPRFSDDNNGNSRGGFGSGNRGRGRGQSFGDTGSSWNGGNNSNESGGGRSDDQWNRRDFDGSRGRGRGCFGRGGRNQGNNFGSGDGSSWSSGRGNSGRGGYRNWNDNERRPPGQGGGWSQSSGWNSNRGTSEGDQGFSKSKLRWGSDNNDSWGVPKSSDGDDQARKGDGNNTWRQNSSSSSILGQPSGGGNVSWEKSNEDSWNSSRGTGSTEKSSWGGSEVAPKKDGLLEQDKGSGNQGVGGSSSWDKADDAWNSNKGSDSGSGGW
ncbi:hypothetical protein QOZ80_5AG0367480 [Eleusine coracana subsp. coracana]|nr:hypothetical protein QOZ80_5AG0367480 [Eleusine coracana subsp. coracana]